MKMEEEQGPGDDLGLGPCSQRRSGRRQLILGLDYSGLYENSQKHMLDFDDLEFSQSQKNSDIQNCSQKNIGFLGEDVEEYEDNSQRRRLEEMNTTDLPNSQVLTVNAYEWGLGGSFGQKLDLPGELDASQLSLDENEDGQIGLNDTINTDQENALMHFLTAGGAAGGLGSQLQLSQGSLDDLDSCSQKGPESTEVKEGLGSENISLENFEGPFGFKITPIETNKCCFTPEHNKFYCDTGTYGFEIDINFDKIENLSKYVIRAALVFTDPQYQNTPVVKCVNCAETQKKILTDDKEKEMVACHIVRGHQDDSQVTYTTSPKTKYCYAIIGLPSQPEPGCKTLVQKLIFTCRSSCKTDEVRGIGRRQTALVFTLLNPQKVICGRSVINLRICSAPYRDLLAEFKDAAIAYRKRQGRKRKPVASSSNRRARVQPNEDEEEENDEDDAVAEPPPAKMRAEARRKKSGEGDVAPPLLKLEAKQNEDGPPEKVDPVEVQRKKARDDGDDEEPIPSTSSALKDSFDIERAVEVLYNSSQESSSQESVIEYDDDKGVKHSVKLHKLSKECKKVLMWIDSGDPVQQSAAVQVFESLKFAEQICSKSKEMIKAVQSRSDSIYRGRGSEKK